MGAGDWRRRRWCLSRSGVAVTNKITASGIYDLTMEQYRGQPADALSMASSDAVTLIESTPAHLQASWTEGADDSAQLQLVHDARPPAITDL